MPPLHGQIFLFFFFHEPSSGTSIADDRNFGESQFLGSREEADEMDGYFFEKHYDLKNSGKMYLGSSKGVLRAKDARVDAAPGSPFCLLFESSVCSQGRFEANARNAGKLTGNCGTRPLFLRRLD